MGFQYILSGFIECKSGAERQSQEAIQSFDFDQFLPFPDIFSRPVTGYQCHLISFAGSFKDFEKIEDAWFKGFEYFIEKLDCLSAEVIVEQELYGEFLRIGYVDNKDQSKPESASYTKYERFRRTT